MSDANATPTPDQVADKQEEKESPNAKDGAAKDIAMTWPVVIACIFGAFLFLYIFLVGLTIMGDAFKVLGGRGAGSMFTAVENPVAGVMTGVLATVLVQSSSTSTSVVVTMVGAGVISVKQGIPIIMGANIGTSVTNTIVAMGWTGNRIDLERAFSGATVHDMFNMLTVLTLLPLEALVAAIQGEGGLLYWVSYGVTEAFMGGEKAGKLFESPVKTVAKPVASLALKSNKYVIYAMTLGPPEAKTPAAVNQTLCKGRRLAEKEVNAEVTGSSLSDGASTQRSLLSRRLADDLQDCSNYYCLGSGQDKNFKKISSKSYKKLTKCDDYVLDNDGKPCKSKEKCYMDAGKYYDTKVEDGRLIKGGFVEGAGDIGGGIIGLLISIVLLSIGMMGLTKTLSIIFMSKANALLKYSTKVNDYLAILIGAGVTILVQSSSVTTSALTPLCAIGVLPLIKMLPLTLGANIGTTCTAFLASLVSLKFGAVQIALCHLFFNITGILIWFPIPKMREIPLGAARTLGLYASYYRFTPPLYILVMFVIVPLIFLGVSAVIDASVAGGVILFICVLIGFGFGTFFWAVGYPMDGEHALCYQVLSKEQRAQGEKELAEANAALYAGSVADESKDIANV
jgi:sodium-dependent phosphate cotransporter